MSVTETQCALSGSVARLCALADTFQVALAGGHRLVQPLLPQLRGTLQLCRLLPGCLERGEEIVKREFPLCIRIARLGAFDEFRVGDL